MGAFLAVIQGAGIGFSAFQKDQAGRQRQAVANRNAQIAEQQATLTEQASASETTRSHEEARRLKGEQISVFSASGAQIGVGTPLLVLADQAGKMERDIDEQRRNRMIEAQGFRSEAEQLRFSGEQAKRAGRIGAFTTLLSGVSSAGQSLFGSGGGKSTKSSGTSTK